MAVCRGGLSIVLDVDNSGSEEYTMVIPLLPGTCQILMFAKERPDRRKM